MDAPYRIYIHTYIYILLVAQPFAWPCLSLILYLSSLRLSLSLSIPLHSSNDSRIKSDVTDSLNQNIATRRNIHANTHIHRCIYIYLYKCMSNVYRNTVFAALSRFSQLSLSQSGALLAFPFSLDDRV